jgi:hypothetical protein
MNTGLKVWLWIVMIVNAIAAISTILVALLVPILFVSALSSIVIIVGAALILFKQKKVGFYVICCMAIVNLVFNVIGGNNMVMSLVSAVVMPGIIYLLMKPTWDVFN